MSALDETLEDLAGFGWIPGIQKIMDGIREAQEAAAAGRLSLDSTQNLAVLLGNDGNPDLIQALAELAAAITNPDTNPALTALDDTTAKTVQRLGEQHARDIAEWTPRTATTEAAGVIWENRPARCRGCDTFNDPAHLVCPTCGT